MGILIKKIIFFTLITFSIEAKEIEEIIFSIKNDIYTTIDLNKRIEYLNTINKFYQNSDKYIDDYISVITFDIFAKEKKVVIDDKIVNKYLSQLSNANKINENKVI